MQIGLSIFLLHSFALFYFVSHCLPFLCVLDAGSCDAWIRLVLAPALAHPILSFTHYTSIPSPSLPPIPPPL